MRRPRTPPPPPTTLASVRDRLAQLLAQPARPFSPDTLRDQVNCARVLLKALTLAAAAPPQPAAPQPQPPPRPGPDYFQPWPGAPWQRRLSPEEWNAHYRAKMQEPKPAPR